MNSMSRVVIGEVGGIWLTRTAVPEPGPGEVLIQTVLAGICGSDIHAIAGKHPLLPPPYCPGHEAVGRVVGVGDGVAVPAVGDRVILKPNVPCGRCQNCQAARTNACQELRWIGCDPSGALPGAMADYVVAPSSNAYVVPDGVTDDQAVLVECLATPIHAARIAGDLKGQRVAVLGGGTIGILAVMTARLAAASKIVVTEMDATKGERALRHGADFAVDATSGSVPGTVQARLGGYADVVFDCVASELSIADSVSMLRRAGTVLVVGVPPREISLPMPLVQDWEMRIQGCANYAEEDFVAAVAMAHELPATEVISDRFSLSDVGAAFRRAAESSSGKVVIQPAVSDE